MTFHIISYLDLTIPQKAIQKSRSKTVTGTGYEMIKDEFRNYRYLLYELKYYIA